MLPVQVMACEARQFMRETKAGMMELSAPGAKACKAA
jgi:hypothetical protein